jgi:Domain of unknown function (DUF5664)
MRPHKPPMRDSTQLFTKALAIAAQVMQVGARTHPENDWVKCSPEHHARRAIAHLRLWLDDDVGEAHLSHAATRLLMALTLRDEIISRRPHDRS